MDKIVKIKCSPNLIKKLKEVIFYNYEELVKDYSKKFNKKDIKKSFIKQRIFARLLSYRSINPNLINPIVDELSKRFKKKLYLAPFFYIRFCNPGEYYNSAHKKSLLYTEPHYDKYTFNNKGLSFWIPLHSTSKSTGTLCYIKKNKDISKKFPVNGKNLYNIENYLKNFKNVDKILKGKVKNVYCNFGEILCFDQNVLHGASGPINKPRISVNFQITFSKKYKKNKGFYFANNFLEQKNILNSLSLGDSIFLKNNSQKIKKLFDKKVPKYLKNKYKSLLRKKFNLYKNDLLHDVHYLKEDSWIN